VKSLGKRLVVQGGQVPGLVNDGAKVGCFLSKNSFSTNSFKIEHRFKRLEMKKNGRLVAQEPPNDRSESEANC
jgi:hypothetical protein